MPYDLNFCPQCLQIFSQPHLLEPWGANRDYHTQPIHHTKQSLQAAALRGCPLCFLFFEKSNGLTNPKWQAIEPDEPLRIHADAESLLPYAGSPREGGMVAQMVDMQEKNKRGVVNRLSIFGFVAEDIVNLLVAARAGRTFILIYVNGD